MNSISENKAASVFISQTPKKRILTRRGMEYSENPIRVLIIEQDRLAVAKLRAILEIDKKMIQVASIDRISSGMNILYEKGWSQSDVVIIQGDSDIDNLGKTIEEIKRYFSTSKILLLMRETNYAYAMEALSTGVFGIIMNDLNNYNIHYAVRSLARGGGGISNPEFSKFSTKKWYKN